MVKKQATIKYYESIGKRKTSVALIRMYIAEKSNEIDVNGLKMKKGEIFVNKKPINVYFSSVESEKRYNLPLELTENIGRFAISIHVRGGGMQGQLEAVMHGLSRGIELADKTKRVILKKEGLLTRDARAKERRKVGTGGKARRKKQSPKR